MRIYAITPRGNAVARSTTAPPTNEWRVLRYLDRVTRSTEDRIATYIGLQRGEAIVALTHLCRGEKPLVMRE